MRWPRRTTHLPDDVRANLGLARGERVLSAARLEGGVWVVATDQGLVAEDWRAQWSVVTHAQWYDDAATLAVTWLGEGGEVSDRSLVLDDPGLLPETVHERVEATILLSRVVAVEGRRGVRVVARRQPGSEDVQWQVVPDEGIDAEAADVSARVTETIRQMSADLGLR